MYMEKMSIEKMIKSSISHQNHRFIYKFSSGCQIFKGLRTNFCLLSEDEWRGYFGHGEVLPNCFLSRGDKSLKFRHFFDGEEQRHKQNQPKNSYKPVSRFQTNFAVYLMSKVGINKESETPWYKVTGKWSTSFELCCCLFLFKGDYHCDEGPGGGGLDQKPP